MPLSSSKTAKYTGTTMSKPRISDFVQEHRLPASWVAFPYSVTNWKRRGTCRPSARSGRPGRQNRAFLGHKHGTDTGQRMPVHPCTRRTLTAMRVFSPSAVMTPANSASLTRDRLDANRSVRMPKYSLLQTAFSLLANALALSGGIDTLNWICHQRPGVCSCGLYFYCVDRDLGAANYQNCSAKRAVLAGWYHPLIMFVRFACNHPYDGRPDNYWYWYLGHCRAHYLGGHTIVAQPHFATFLIQGSFGQREQGKGLGSSAGGKP